MPSILVDVAYLSVFFMLIVDEPQMNHTNDLGPVLQHCSEINIYGMEI